MGTRRVVVVAEDGTVVQPFVTQADTFTATGVGTTIDRGVMPPAHFAIQVKGTGAAPTSWSVNLEGSLDGTNWTTLITHSATDGSTQWSAAATPRPVTHFRSNCTALTLGTATNIVVRVLAKV